jgi:hypothetical protein
VILRETVVKLEGGAEHTVTDDLIKIQEITVSEHSKIVTAAPNIVERNVDRALYQSENILPTLSSLHSVLAEFFTRCWNTATGHVKTMSPEV